jgi:hypothetical protein
MPPLVPPVTMLSVVEPSKVIRSRPAGLTRVDTAVVGSADRTAVRLRSSAFAVLVSTVPVWNA